MRGGEVGEGITVTNDRGGASPHRGAAQTVSHVLSQVSRSQPLPETLEAFTRCARELVGADGAGLRLERTPGSPSRSNRDACTFGGLVCVAADTASARESRRDVCPARSTRRYAAFRSVPLAGGDGGTGELWVGRREDRPFTAAEDTLLRTLAELVVAALRHARMLEDEHQAAVVAERGRIAREMHDGLAQALGATHLRLRALSSRIGAGADTDAVRHELEELADLCQESCRDVRETISALRESSRTDRTLLEALDAYVRGFTRTSGVHTVLDADPASAPPLSPLGEVQVIRIVQEALTNVRKHSGARTARVRVQGSRDHTVFVVEDDGAGFDPHRLPRDGEGYGLHAMRERSELVSGRLAVESVVGRGTRILVTLPHGRGEGGTEGGGSEEGAA